MFPVIIKENLSCHELFFLLQNVDVFKFFFYLLYLIAADVGARAKIQEMLA